MIVSLYSVLLLGICVLDSKGHDSSNSLVLVTSIFSSSTDIPKLFSALQHYITNVDFVILQRVGRNGSSSLYNTLSQGKNWSLWEVTDKDLLSWLSDRTPRTLICVTDNSDIPKILISAQQRGLLPSTKVAIWIAKNKAIPGTIRTARITSTFPEFEFADLNVTIISFKSVQSLFMDVLQKEHHARVRRAFGVLGTSAMVGNSSVSTVEAFSASSSLVNTPPAIPSQASQSSVKMYDTSYSFTTGGSAARSSLTSTVTDITSANEGPRNSLPLSSTSVAFSSTRSSFSRFNPYSSAVMVGASPKVVMTSLRDSSSLRTVRSSSLGSGVLFASHFASTSSTVQTSSSSLPSSSILVSGYSSVTQSPAGSPSSSSKPGNFFSVVASPISPSSSSPVVGISSTMVTPLTRPYLSSTVATVSQSQARSVADTSVASIFSSVSLASSQVVTTSTSASTPTTKQAFGLVSTFSTAQALTTRLSLFGSETSSVITTARSSLTSVVGSYSESFSPPASDFTSRNTRALPSSSMQSPHSSRRSRLSFSSASSETTSNRAVQSSSMQSPYSSHRSMLSFSSVSSEKFSAVSTSPISSSSPSPHSSFLFPQSITLAFESSSMSSSLSSQFISSFASVPSKEEASTVFKSQATSVSSLFFSSSYLPQSSLVGSSTTAITVVSTDVSLESGSLFTTVISPSSTKEQPSSSSQEVTTEPPPVYKNETMTIEFMGDCRDIEGNEDDFKEAFKNEISEKLGISEASIRGIDINCGSILVTFTITAASGKANISQSLKQFVDSGNITVKVMGKSYTAISLKVILPSTSSAAPLTTAKAPAKKNIKLILYITFGVVIGCIFVVGIVGLVVRYRSDRRAGAFFLTNESTNYELRRFHGIPRAKNYFKVNYYGEPVELDATASDPNLSDEFQAQEGDIQYNQGSSLDRVKPIAAANSDDKFNVGAMGLPEWKNLPKLSKSEVAVTADTKHGNSKSLGADGSKTHLLPGETPLLDNPIVTFGDVASGLEKEEDLDHAYDNPVATIEDGPSAP
ncbi:streptococcal hemagglutinin-like [Montipora foliosa]|uniref:streptococcal hemagglutinin-like n=1 Tax=Montipora foliosa TaxID=591990 RepID=UPI0035F19559